MTIKIAVNRCYGGFGLSDAAVVRYAELKGIKLYVEPTKLVSTFWVVPPGPDRMTLIESNDAWCAMSEDERAAYDKLYFAQTFDQSHRDISRDDPLLIQVIEEMGAAADGDFAKLTIVEIPDDMAGRWEIDEYDGMEHVCEQHRTWS